MTTEGLLVGIPLASSGANKEMPINTNVMPKRNIVILSVPNTCQSSSSYLDTYRKYNGSRTGDNDLYKMQAHLIFLKVYKSCTDREEGPCNLKHGNDEDCIKQRQSFIQSRHLTCRQVK